MKMDVPGKKGHLDEAVECFKCLHEYGCLWAGTTCAQSSQLLPYRKFWLCIEKWISIG